MNLTPTRAALRKMWMSQPFAGPTEKYDAGVEFDTFMARPYLGVYNDMLGGDVETALNTLAELLNLGAVDSADDLSERQVEIAYQVYGFWSEEQNR
jgi:hypothetical protein